MWLTISQFTVVNLLITAMTSRKQAENNLGRRLRKRMVDLDLSFSALAKTVKRPRETVSRAVHHGKFPRVLREIREVLDV